MLVGCATGRTPKQAVQDLEAVASSPGHQTTDCRATKEIAKNFDDQEIPRLATRITLSTILGPLSWLVNRERDKEHQKKRDVVIAQMYQSCPHPL